jgi:hypothetical protein
MRAFAEPVPLMCRRQCEQCFKCKGGVDSSGMLNSTTISPVSTSCSSWCSLLQTRNAHGLPLIRADLSSRLSLTTRECGLCGKTNEDMAHRHCHICGIPRPVRYYVVAGPNRRCIYGQFKYLTNNRHTTINLRRHPMNVDGVCNARTQSPNSYRRTWILFVV